MKPFRVLLLLALIVLTPLALTIAAMVMPGPLAENKTVVVPRGDSVSTVAALLKDNNVIDNTLIFRLAAKLFARDSLKAGEYNFRPGQSIADIVLTMREGHSVVRLFTAAEGLTSVEIVDLLKDDPSLTGTVTAIPAEGSLLPESYRYNYGDTRDELIKRMQKSMQDALDEDWKDRDGDLPIKIPQEAVIMASVIEKETSKPDERARIAGVFYNRLRQSMRLQSDPTVIYAITRGKTTMNRLLSRDDLTFPSPYNTYVSDGLPPKPICNPGRAALEAAVHPEKNDYLYFVADGTGGHVFSKSLAEHNQHVSHWQHLQKMPLVTVPKKKPDVIPLAKRVKKTVEKKQPPKDEPTKKEPAKSEAAKKPPSKPENPAAHQ